MYSRQYSLNYTRHRQKRYTMLRSTRWYFEYANKFYSCIFFTTVQSPVILGLNCLVFSDVISIENRAMRYWKVLATLILTKLDENWKKSNQFQRQTELIASCLKRSGIVGISVMQSVFFHWNWVATLLFLLKCPAVSQYVFHFRSFKDRLLCVIPSTTLR